MIVLDSIGWVNTGLPLLVLTALAVGLPRYLVDRHTRSHAKVARGMLAVVTLLLLAGFVLSMVVTQARGFDAEAHLLANPGEGFGMHARLSLLSGIFWGPILVLVWFGQAQAVEDRRGRDIVLSDREGS